MVQEQVKICSSFKKKKYMKNRNLDHKDDWATPNYVYDQLHKQFNFDFDPCPFMHNLEVFNGLECEWGTMNFVNPPYSLQLKTAFVMKAIEEMKKRRSSLLLLPASVDTKLFHHHILPNASEIIFVEGRIKFVGVNTKGEAVNAHLRKDIDLGELKQVKNSGMHGSILVLFTPYRSSVSVSSLKFTENDR